MSSPLPVALLFPGQGAQHHGMAVDLYQREPTFTAAIDEVFEGMGAAGEELRLDWLADLPAVSIDHVTRSTPLLFAVGYALGRLVMSWGVEPVAVLGHSIGEMVAATLAGIFRVADAASLVAERVRVLETAPPGGMLAVAASPEQLQHYLGGDLAVAAVNAPGQTVLSGLTGSIEAVTARLGRDGFICRRVPAFSPFHSPAMADLAVLEAPAFAAVTMRAPEIAVFSSYTGGPLSTEQATDPGFWTRHPAMPVLFWPALNALVTSRRCLLVEVGPGEGLSTLARRHPLVATGNCEVDAMLPRRPDRAGDDLAAVRRLVDRLGGATVAGVPC